MANLSLTVRYRPARIGWCVRTQNWDDLRTALKLTHIFWGGKFNPIIPFEAQNAKSLIKQFRVDVLFPVNGSPEAVEFTRTFQSLGWPLLRTELVNERGVGDGTPSFLDVSYPLTKIADQLRLHDKKLDEPPEVGFGSSDYVIIRSSEDDPLRDVLMATFGAYPTRGHTGRDYEGFFVTNIAPFAYNH
jgi:hypothetical protein